MPDSTTTHSAQSTVELAGQPSLRPLLLKGVATTPLRRGKTLPSTEYVLRDQTVDRTHLATYNRICGFPLRNAVPVTYPHILAFRMHMRLMTDRDFPFPLLGTVHVANRIEQNHPVLVTDQLTQRVWLDNLRPHSKGQQFDVVTETFLQESGNSPLDLAAAEPVWREVSTYLRKGKGDESTRPQENLPQIEPGNPTAVWQLPAGLGRRYADISDDHNPIHVSTPMAKAFGFPRTIAHGMWSAARCLAALDARLPQACKVDIGFRKPVILPSTVEFSQRRGIEHEHEFALHSRKGKLHLAGSVDPLRR